MTLFRSGLRLGAAALVAATFLGGGAVYGQIAALPVGGIDCVVDPERELMIRHISVVEDCIRTKWDATACADLADRNALGAWTFGRLIAGVAGTHDPDVLSSFVLDWLAHWEQNVVVNSFTSPARPSIRTQVTLPWLAASGGSRLDMKLAPFRLLAIVNRIDLRRQGAYGGGHAGEGRFVFGVLGPSGNALSFTVIFEYRLNAATCEEIQTWARRWHGLGSIPFGPQYNRELQAITDTFTRIGADPRRPNGSAINQIRTNEIALASPWDLREFVLTADDFDPVVVPLRQTTVKLTPNRSVIPGQNLLGSQRVADFINEFEIEILSGDFDVPEIYQGQPFLGAATINNIDFWNGLNSPLIFNNEARHIFSLNSCNGCHGRETNTGFLQVFPRAAGQQSGLAGFLTGVNVVDPIDTNVTRHFNDLQRRAEDLCRLLNTPCDELLLTDQPLLRTH